MNFLWLLAEGTSGIVGPSQSSGLLWLRELLQPQILVFMVPLAGICGGITIAVVKAVIKHRERMAKIEQGIDPDAPYNNPQHQ